MRKIRAAALILLLLGAGSGYALFQYYTGDQFLRKTILTKLTSHYPQYKISLGRARFDLSSGQAFLDRLTLGSPSAGRDAGLVRVPEIVLRIDRAKLRRSEVEVRQLTVNQPRLRATRLPNGGWDVADLLPLPRFSDSLPEVSIRGGTIELYDALGAVPRRWVFRNVNMHLTPEGDHRFRFSGSLEGDHLSEAHLEGHVDLDEKDWLVTGLVENLAWGPELLGAIPTAWAEEAEPLRGITALLEVRCRLGQSGEGEPIQYDFEAALESGRLEVPGVPLSLKSLTAGSLVYREGHIKAELQGRDGRFFHPGLPFGLYDVAASIAIEDDRIESRMNGRNGLTEVRADASFEAGDFHHPTRVALEISRLPLDERVYAKLPDGLRGIWDRFSPQGEVNLVFRAVQEEGPTWRHQGVLTSLGGSFRFDGFPYRLTGVTGTVRDEQDQIDVDLVGRAGNRAVKLAARLDGLGSESAVSVEVTGEKIPIDRKLLAALPEPYRNVVESLNPTGFVDVHTKVWREAGPNQSFKRSQEFALQNSAMRHAAFPYALSQITGAVIERKGRWLFQKLRGYNDTAEVEANGSLEPSEQGGRFNLQLAGRNVPFEDELRRALPARWASVWEACAPRGAAQVRVNLHCRPGESLQVSDLKIKLDGASMRLRAFPYRWDNVTATIELGEGKAIVRNLAARHEAVQLLAHAHVAMSPDGAYTVRIGEMDVQNMALDRPLLEALPDGLARFFRRIELEGPLDLQDTTLEFSGEGRQNEPVRALWKMNVQLSDSSFRCGQRLEHVYGLVAIAGGYDGTQSRGEGSITLDSLSLKGIQLTKATGPFRWESGNLTFGSNLWENGAGGPIAQDQGHLQAKLLGGMVTADAIVGGQRASYRLRASLRGARLEEYAKLYMPDRQRLRGRLSGHVELAGRLEGSVRPQGHGQLRVGDGDLYELPLVLALLKIPSLQVPDNTAFTEASAKFRFTPEQIDIKPIKLTGDAVTLIGEGRSSYDRKLDLTFYTMVGRDTIRIPLVTDLFRGASEQLLAIHVKGHFQSPRAAPEIVPQVTDAMRQLLGMKRQR